MSQKSEEIFAKDQTAVHIFEGCCFVRTTTASLHLPARSLPLEGRCGLLRNRSPRNVGIVVHKTTLQRGELAYPLHGHLPTSLVTRRGQTPHSVIRRIRNLPSSSHIGVGWLHVQRREPTAGRSSVPPVCERRPLQRRFSHLNQALRVLSISPCG